MRILNATELERLIARYRKQLAKTNGDGGDDLARVGARIEKRIVREILGGSGEVTAEQLQSLQKAMRQAIAQGNVGFQATMDKYVPDVYRTSLEKMADVGGMTMFTPRAASRLLEVVDNFERSITDRSILRTSGGYTDLWRGEWTDEWTRTARVVQSKFTGAVVTGQEWSSVAGGLVDDLGSLNIQGRMNTEDFARAFTRTKFRELYVDSGIQFAKEAGLDLFINIGVPDDVQSEECYDASNEDPKTLDEWGDDIPPRHVFNCRCDLVAVPDDVKWEGQTNPTIDAKRERRLQEVAA